MPECAKIVDESSVGARRHFLRCLSMAVGTAYIAGCGSSGGDSPPGSPAPSPSPGAPPPGPTPSPTPPSPPAPITPPAPAPSGARQFHLTSSAGGPSLPFTIGFAFKQGDVPAGNSIAASLTNVQATVKNRWPDGSVRFAIIAGRATLGAGVAQAVTLSASTAATSGTALGTSDLRATGVAASIGCGGFGTVTWSGTDWDSPFVSWVSGPEMSSWIYRRPVGADAHLVGWLEVRLYAGGAVEVLPWIENGYIRVGNPTSKSAGFTFSLGGTQRFSASIDLPSHCRTPLISGGALSYWLGADPAIVPRHDADYMQSTRLVPTYLSSIAANASVVGNLPTTFTPLALGNFTAAMGQAGFQPAIGLIPEWDALYLTCPAPATYYGVVRNGYSGGRWGIHFRDENTNRPLRFSQFPTLSVNTSTINDQPPAPTGTAAPGWDVPHHPSLGFMAYLVTGRFYFMEQVLFAATINYLKNVDGGPYANRNGSAGLFLSNAGANTVRGAAWAIRTLTQAALAAADDDAALRGEFIASLEANINFHHAKYVAQPNNPFGIVQTYGDTYGSPTDGRVTEAPWQQDFHTAAVGYALAASPPISSAARTRLSEFFAWKARSAVGRLGGTSATEWLYRDAAVYNLAVALVDEPDWTTGTGPWPTSWGAMYQTTLGVPNPGVTGDLRGGNFPESTSYWGNLQPAIAYAVEHGVPGALAAYARMTGASNWSQLLASAQTTPVWAVRPRT